MITDYFLENLMYSLQRRLARMRLRKSGFPSNSPRRHFICQANRCLTQLFV